MPLKQTIYGGECPLGKFQVIGLPGWAGWYDSNPAEHCLSCNLADTSSKTFDLEKICKCPADITSERYSQLEQQYLALENNNLTKEQFQDFIKENYKNNQQVI